MSKLIWDQEGTKTYETGVSNGVLYVKGATGYNAGVAWNGLISVTESPSGAEPTPLYADNKKYLTLMSSEEFGASIEAYTYPEEFEVCDGSAQLALGVTIQQQPRATFGLAYKTIKGNDTEGENHGYKLHIIYGAKAAPSEKAYGTINDSPEAMTFSWELTTTPVEVAGHNPTATVVIDSTKIEAGKLKKIEDLLFGTEAKEASLPTPDEILALVSTTLAALMQASK